MAESDGLKPEYMTSLSGNRLVSKAHGRIAFRGAVDSLEAELIEAQILAEELGEPWYRESLGEVLGCLRGILAAEVKEIPLAPPCLFGLSSDELRRQSHDVKGTFGMEHPLPDHTMGPLAARLNLLRARTREAELLAVRVFCAGEDSREDLILAMNRLSSALYWLFCRQVSGNNPLSRDSSCPQPPRDPGDRLPPGPGRRGRSPAWKLPPR